ncbi:MAG TPA: AAA family ATPase [Chloroflexia bacterium]|nr:AAA family ATPase [Chloroflexia bacterium]
MSKAKVICLAQSKGGTAKTSSAVNIGACLVREGYKVLLVDLDPQANLTTSVGVEPSDLARTNYELFTDHATEASAILQPTAEGMDLLPSSIDLAVVERNIRDAIGREKILARKLTPLRASYDYIICDTSPYFNLLTTNGMAAADYILIPVQPEPNCIRGLGQVYEQVVLVQENLNPQMQLLGVFIVMYDNRINGHQFLTAQVRENWEDYTFDTIIRRRSNILQATAENRSVVQAQPTSDLAQDYIALTREVVKRARQ